MARLALQVKDIRCHFNIIFGKANLVQNEMIKGVKS
jgi:hypothetical protein